MRYNQNLSNLNLVFYLNLILTFNFWASCFALYSVWLLNMFVARAQNSETNRQNDQEKKTYEAIEIA